MEPGAKSAMLGKHLWADVGARLEQRGRAVDRIGSSIIDFTESAYDLTLSGKEWLPEVLRRGLPVLDHGLGVAGYEYGRPPDGGPVELLHCHVASGPADFAERHMRALETTDPDVLRRQLMPGAATTGSEYARGRPEELEHYISHVTYCKDVLFLTAVDVRGAGVAVVAPLEKVTTLSSQDAQRWQMLAAHVEAGHRLRRNLDAEAKEDDAATPLPHDAEAVLDGSTFKLADAVGVAQGRDTTRRLREAAVAVDRARGQMRERDPERALRLWKALVRGRWSLVDWFDTDGRRYLLAIPNRPHAADPRGLSERENQVVTYAVFGHTNKMIAYRLGLSTSRVSTLLRSAMRKLGFRTRTQLVKQMRDLQALR